MNKNLRSANRFVTFIRAIGGEPIPFGHDNYRDWARALQRQYDQLRQKLDRDTVRSAQSYARTAFRRVGYRRAAEEAVPIRATPSAAPVSRASFGSVARETIGPSIQSDPALSAKQRRAMKRDQYVCRSKLRHLDYWSAMLHSKRLGPELRVYHCEICEGLHVAHDPMSPRTEQYRHARRRLRTINNKLVALTLERESLVRERDRLLRELGHEAGLRPIAPTLAAVVRRLAHALRRQSSYW